MDRLHTRSRPCTADPDPVAPTVGTLTLRELGLAVASATDDLVLSDNIYRQRVRLEALAHYGGVCACCGEDNAYVLTFDHKNGDGAAQRRLNGSRPAYRARRGQYPADIQVLCQSCNWAKGTQETCPCRDAHTVAELLDLLPARERSRGERHHKAKLRNADIPAIRSRLAAGESGASIARAYGVYPGTISQIKQHKTWRNI